MGRPAEAPARVLPLCRQAAEVGWPKTLLVCPRQPARGLARRGLPLSPSRRRPTPTPSTLP
eukprot:9478695-Pyramimonas_sp.AAC.1